MFRTLETLEFHSRVPIAPDRAYAYLSDPRHLDGLTPGWLRFRLVDAELPPLTLGSEIDYDFRWRGLPMVWRSRITDWRPPERFSYEQVRGPYRHFRHDHLFFEQESGTLVVDRVVFLPPGGRLAAWLFVSCELKRIFAFRARLLDGRFPWASTPSPRETLPRLIQSGAWNESSIQQQPSRRRSSPYFQRRTPT